MTPDEVEVLNRILERTEQMAVRLHPSDVRPFLQTVSDMLKAALDAR